jgi:DNA-directed RNA polymerase subunit RPC12/RpoP
VASEICLSCGYAVAGMRGSPCPECGETVRGTVSGGAITRISAESDAACQRCGQTGVDLRFAKFRWVLGLVFLDQIHWRAGYYCNACIRREFFRSQSLTMVLGWWGILAFFVRNPISIVGNFKALARPPLFAEEWGAIAVADQSRKRAVAGALLGPRPRIFERSDDGGDLEAEPDWVRRPEDDWPQARPEDAPLCAGSPRKAHPPVTTFPVADPNEPTYRCPTCGREQRLSVSPHAS